MFQIYKKKKILICSACEFLKYKHQLFCIKLILFIKQNLYCKYIVYILHSKITLQMPNRIKNNPNFSVGLI